jgi:hypothetical protein
VRSGAAGRARARAKKMVLFPRALALTLLSPPCRAHATPFSPPPPLPLLLRAQALKQCAGGALGDCLFFARAVAGRPPAALAPAFAALATFDVLCVLQRFYLLLKPGESEAEGAADAAAGVQVAAGALEALLARGDRGAEPVAGALPGVLEGLRAALSEVEVSSAWMASTLDALRARLAAAQQ